jgi:isopenicillin N synthase-like dioxygenase
MDVIPIVDLEPWENGDAAARAGVARALDAACRNIGFMQVVGHGLPASVSQALRRETEAFFDLPLPQKLACSPGPTGFRGYAPLGSEALAYSLGVAPNAPDLFEAFNVGPELVPDDDWHRKAPDGLFAPNIWPAEMPALQAAVMAYFNAAMQVAFRLTEVFAAALGLPEGWFRPHVDRATLALRILNYERRPAEAPPRPGQMRMGAHTDYGMVTVLSADAVPGLQVLAPDGCWLDVSPVPGALLVNLGDMTALWTNDRWRSTLHRVVPPPAGTDGRAKRRSAAFFLDPYYDALIECVPTCRSSTEAPRYAPVVAGEHLIQKILGPRLLAASRATNTAADRWGPSGRQ